MMNYEIFKEVVKEKFMDYMQDNFKGMELVVMPVEKVNMTYDGISIRGKDTNISPTIYINDMYEKYQNCGDLEETLMAACDLMAMEFAKTPQVVDVDSLYKDADENVVFQLINTEQNRSFLEQVPHREFQDLSIIYKLVINADAESIQSIKVTNSLAERLGMNEEQLFKYAAENTRRILPPRIRNMNDVMKEMFLSDGMPEEIAEMMIREVPPEQTLWIISNNRGIDGAVSMLYENELHELAENLESDLYILPSSVHEVLAVSTELTDPEELAQMVAEVNMQKVALEERLSNQVYHYDKDLRKLTLATDTPNKRLDGIVAEPQLVYDARRIIMNADMKWLDNPEVFRVNQLDAHSDHCYYMDYADMEKSENPLMQSLNGQWEFAFSKNVMDRPENFYEENFDASSFDKIMVPGHIELAGYDKIRYINTMYPWEGKEYHRGAYSMESTGDEAGMFSEAEYNPVGSYIKRFDLSEQMREKKIRICFEGVEEAMYLWLNGQFVGYAEDSFTPSEFDLTPFIREKGNVLAVQVHKMSTAAFLEDQDFFRFFGIFRNVTLKAVPEVHLEDVWFQPTLNKDNISGRVSVKMKVSAPEGKKVSAHLVLKDRENNQVAEDNITLEEKAGSLVGVIDTEVGSVKAWDNYCPYLYHAYVELRGEDGEILEIIPYDIGFRRLEMIDKVIYLNGKRLVITGVNRHEWSAKTGRSISMDEMTADIDCMIRNNINAVRTCHYPDQIPWYYLCDKAGIYVMAETNMESHGTFQKLGAIEPSCSVPCSIPQWREAVVDRARSNFETFKNHTAILFWSLGNESYAGDDIEAMNTYFKEKQDGRFVHYESSFYDRNYEETISDVESRMYAKPYEVEEYLNNNPKKPYLLCEYMHDMGNSMGGLGTYMKLIDKYEMYHGGFIWDFIDQALLVKDEVTGKEVLRYGGDFDDKPSDYEFSGNGIVFADRKEKPAMQEVRYYYGLYR